MTGLLTELPNTNCDTMAQVVPGTSEQQLQAMTAERNQLLAENARLKDLQQQVAELQKQLGFKQSRPELKVVSAAVSVMTPTGRRGRW